MPSWKRFWEFGLWCLSRGMCPCFGTHFAEMTMVYVEAALWEIRMWLLCIYFPFRMGQQQLWTRVHACNFAKADTQKGPLMYTPSLNSGLYIRYHTVPCMMPGSLHIMLSFPSGSQWSTNFHSIFRRLFALTLKHPEQWWWLFLGYHILELPCLGN